MPAPVWSVHWAESFKAWKKLPSLVNINNLRLSRDKNLGPSSSKDAKHLPVIFRSLFPKCCMAPLTQEEYWKFPSSKKKKLRYVLLVITSESEKWTYNKSNNVDQWSMKTLWQETMSDKSHDTDPCQIKYSCVGTLKTKVDNCNTYLYTGKTPLRVVDHSRKLSIQFIPWYLLTRENVSD